MARLQFVHRIAVARGVRARELRKRTRRRAGRQVQILERSLGALGQPAKPVSLSFSTPIASAISQAPAATAYTAPRSASVPVAHRFSTRVAGTLGSRSAIDSGSADLPVLCSSKNTPSHAASMRSRAMPASASASLERLDHQVVRTRSPSARRNREQPMPMITTLSLIPLAMLVIVALRPWWPSRNSGGNLAVRSIILDAEHETHGYRRP